MLSANMQKLIPLSLDLTKVFINEIRFTAVKSTKAEGKKGACIQRNAQSALIAF